MNQIISVLYALAFVQLVISQDACLDAQSALTANATCMTAFDSTNVTVMCVGPCRALIDNVTNSCDGSRTAVIYSIVIDTFCSPCSIAEAAARSNNCIGVTDPNIVCMGTCRSLLDNFINSCDNATGSFYALIDSLCSPCSMAQTALSSSNTSCTGVTDPNILCMGTCRSLYDTIISSCDNDTASSYSLTIDTFCSPCGMAEAALSSNTDCIGVTDPNILCMGTCRSLYDNLINNCDNETASSYSFTIDTFCSPCGMAQVILSSNTDCIGATDPNILCMGTCRNLYETIINNCDNDIASGISIVIDTLCSPCSVAQAVLSSNTDCIGTTDPNIACMGACRSLYDTVISSCDNQIASTVSTVVSSLCGGGDTGTACQTAGRAIDDSCLFLLSTSNPAVCFGTCGVQVSITVTACASTSDSDIQEFISAYNLACLSGPQCTAALQAFNADTVCIGAFRNDNKATYCSGTCRTLLETAFDSCPNNDFYIREEYNQDCGRTGSDNVLQASGIITLLLVAICALID